MKNKKKKILVIGPSDKLSKGGISTVIGQMRESGIIHESFDVVFFASYIDAKKFIRILYCLLAFIKFIFVFHKYDLFHIHVAAQNSTYRKNMYVKVLKLAKKKIIIHVHGSEYLKYYESTSPKNQKVIEKFLNSADMVIALSDWWKKVFINVMHVKKCEVLENAVDCEKYKAGQCDVSQYSDSMLFLGRIGKRKGIYDLIDAMEIALQKNNKLKLFVAGDGEIQVLKEYIKTKGNIEDHIDILGWISKAETIQIMKNVSMLILPSYNEGLPMSIIEAMAAGKVIISTTVGSIPEVIDVTNGILISPGDIEALADAIDKCSTDIEFLTISSGNNILKAQKCYSLESMHHKLLEIYKNVVYSQGEK